MEIVSLVTTLMTIPCILLVFGPTEALGRRTIFALLATLLTTVSFVVDSWRDAPAFLLVLDFVLFLFCGALTIRLAKFNQRLNQNK